MLSKCANPVCAARFRYLHEGRIFNLQASERGRGARPSTAPTEYYWLCAACSRTWRVARRNGAVIVERRRLELAQFCSSSAESRLLV
jgi:hypothetical protein